MTIIKLRSLLPAVCLAAATAGVAHAAPITYTGLINGQVFTNSNTTGTVSPTAGLTLIGTFTVNTINFSSYGNTSNTGNGSLDYTIGSFLSSLGATVNGLTSAAAGASLSNTEFEFKGTINLAAGTYTVQHDDGITLSINGGPDVFGGTASGPSFPTPTSFVNTTTGPVGFDLVYAENGFSPATLEASFTPAAVTPEPSSIMLLGTGLVGLAGAVRRRMKK